MNIIGPKALFFVNRMERVAPQTGLPPHSMPQVDDFSSTTCPEIDTSLRMVDYIVFRCQAQPKPDKRESGICLVSQLAYQSSVLSVVNPISLDLRMVFNDINKKILCIIVKPRGTAKEPSIAFSWEKHRHIVANKRYGAKQNRDCFH